MQAHLRIMSHIPMSNTIYYKKNTHMKRNVPTGCIDIFF